MDAHHGVVFKGESTRAEGFGEKRRVVKGMPCGALGARFFSFDALTFLNPDISTSSSRFLFLHNHTSSPTPPQAREGTVAALAPFSPPPPPLAGPEEEGEGAAAAAAAAGAAEAEEEEEEEEEGGPLFAPSASSSLHSTAALARSSRSFTPRWTAVAAAALAAAACC